MAAHAGAGYGRAMRTPELDPADITHAPIDADEAGTLRGFLNLERDMMRYRTGGLTAEQLDTHLPPSTMTLGGMLKHLAYVEDWWVTQVLCGRDAPHPWADVDWAADADWDWHSAASDTPTDLAELFAKSVRRNEDALWGFVAAQGLGGHSALPGRAGNTFTARWIVNHLIEEYAQHNGHADLIRESIDGQTGGV